MSTRVLCIHQRADLQGASRPPARRLRPPARGRFERPVMLPAQGRGCSRAGGGNGSGTFGATRPPRPGNVNGAEAAVPGPTAPGFTDLAGGT